MMKRIFFSGLCLLLGVAALRADGGGMWLPNLIEKRIGDMQSRGSKLSAEDIYSVNRASMKDAIVRFGRGCTGEIVSSEGLLLTNHHCGRDQIQNHSSIDHDYLTNGFWAMNRAEELPNPGLVVTFLVRMEDVTSKMLAGTEGMNETDSKAVMDRNKAAIIAEATKGTHYEAAVESFYYGNQYFLFVNEVFKDVRLVAAPPSSIGNFGGDTDNWMWPRHTGDFSIFRVYAGKDNKPAAYSKDNVPYKPKKYLKVSTEGLKEGDFTMVYGFPAVTQQFLHSAAVSYLLHKSNPTKIRLRTIRLDEIKAAQETDPAIRIAYAAKAASIANAWKKWQGESLGLERLGTIDRKKEFEARFAAWAAGKPLYGTVVSDLQREYDELAPYAFARDLYNEAFNAVELMTAAKNFLAAYDEGKTETPDNIKKFYQDYYPAIDRRLAVTLLNEYMDLTDAKFVPESFRTAVGARGGMDKYVDWLFNNSILVSGEKVTEAFADPAIREKVRNNDPAIKLYEEFLAMYRSGINKPYTDINSQITALYKTFVRGMMEYEPGRDWFPDANSTLRVAYGNVESYIPSDGVTHLYQSAIEGIMQKDNPDIYDYNIPQSLRNIYDKRDYGRWASDGTLPVCFLATNHTTGGNSGSPVLNSRGELIGLNFDRTWLSTMSDIQFDPVMCRNISVNIRYVLFVIDRIGGAGYLIREMGVK